MYSIKSNKAIRISFCCFHSNWLYPHLLLIFIALFLVNATPSCFSVIAHFMYADLTNVLFVTCQCLILYIHTESAGFWLPACKKCLLDLAGITVYVCHCVCLHMCHFPMHTQGFCAYESVFGLSRISACSRCWQSAKTFDIQLLSK